MGPGARGGGEKGGENMKFEIAVIIFLGVIVQTLTFLLGFLLGGREAEKKARQEAAKVLKDALGIFEKAGGKPS